MAHLLYIEDDQRSRRLVKRILGKAGHTIVLAENGIEGLRVAQEGLFDLVLMDINLGSGQADLKGTEVTTQLRTSGLDCPIVAVSANSGETARQMALVAGCTGFIAKPFDATVFLQKVMEFLGGERESVAREEEAEHLRRYCHEVVQSLTQRVHHLEKALRELEELDQAKTEFITLVSHELRTPITIIQGYASLLAVSLEEADCPDNFSQYITELNKGTERLSSLTERALLAMQVINRQVGGNVVWKPFRLDKLIEQVMSSTNPVRSRDLEITLNLTPSTINGEPRYIRVVIEILLENAVTNTPDGGSITVSTEPGSETCRLIVADTGKGIDLAIQKKIFDPFSVQGNIKHHSTATSDREYGKGGIGLGLTILKGIVRSHHGKIHLESSPGQGTTVAIDWLVKQVAEEGGANELPKTGELLFLSLPDKRLGQGGT